nr:Histidine phosphatase superfamily [Naematelia aurantialba]
MTLLEPCKLFLCSRYGSLIPQRSWASTGTPRSRLQNASVGDASMHGIYFARCTSGDGDSNGDCDNDPEHAAIGVDRRLPAAREKCRVCEVSVCFCCRFAVCKSFSNSMSGTDEDRRPLLADEGAAGNGTGSGTDKGGGKRGYGATLSLPSPSAPASASTSTSAPGSVSASTSALALASASASETVVGDVGVGGDEEDEAVAFVGEVPKKGAKQHKQFREIWALCLGLWTAVFCSALSASIVANIQLEIGSSFRAGSLVSWLGTAYLLGLTAMTPLYGRLAQVMGRKGAMLLALGFFFTGTLGCAVAPSMTFILFARVIAGAGSGGLLTVTAIIISDLVSLADRGLYQGGVNVLFGAGASTGAVLGGAVADRFGWRAAFWMQVPAILTATALVITQVHVPHHKGELSAWEKVKRIDWAGSVVLMVSMSSFSIAVSLATSSGYPWSHPLVVGLLGLAVFVLPPFAYIESKAAEPIVPLTLLTRVQTTLVLMAFVLTTATTFARLFMQPVYLHVTRGLNGSQTGLLLLPSSIAGSASSLYAGWHMRHYKEYKWFQFIASLVPWIQAISIMVFWGPETSVHRLWVEMAIGSLGGGAIITTLLTSLIATVGPHEMSLAISACYLFRAIGQVVGVAIAAAIQQSVLLRSLTERLGDLPDAAALIHSIIQEPASVIPHLDKGVQVQAKLGYLASIEAVFGFVVAGGAVLSAICLSLRAHRL